MSNLRELQSLKLIDLMLERFEAKHLLDEVLDSCCMALRILYLVNVTSVHCPIMHVGLFLNLKVSPNKINFYYMHSNLFCVTPTQILCAESITEFCVLTTKNGCGFRNIFG
jgi:hypothetical protein